MGIGSSEASGESRAEVTAGGGRRWARVLAGLLALAVVGTALAVAVRAWIGGRMDPAAAREALAAGRPDEAELEVARLLRDHPESAEAHYLAARVALAQGRAEDAVAALERARARGYSESALQSLFAVLMARAGRRDEAEPILRRAFDGAPTLDPEVADALVLIYDESARYPEALKVLDRWAAAAPADPRPHAWRSRLHIARGEDPAVILDDLREVLRRDPDDKETRRRLGDAYLRAGKLEESAKALDAYLADFPDDASAHADAGVTAAARAREELAQGHAEQADALESEAVAHLDRALALDPNSIRALEERARIALRRRNPGYAATLLDRAVTLDPKSPEARFQHAMALRQIGRESEAAAELEVHARLRREQDQFERIRRKILYAPRDPDVQLEAARWLLGHDRDDEGLYWAELALKARPAHPETLRLLADYYDRKGNAGRARYYRLQIPGDARDDGRSPAS